MQLSIPIALLCLNSLRIEKIIHPEVKTKIILSEIGMINETDISLAKASNAVLIGFNVKANREAKKISEEQKIEIKYFDIIYEAIEYIEKRLSARRGNYFKKSIENLVHSMLNRCLTEPPPLWGANMIAVLVPI